LFVGQKEKLPEQVPETTIEAFQRDGHPTPDRDNIKLDWTASLSTSQWNKMAIGFLAEMFIDRLQLGDYPAVKPDPKVINITSIIDTIRSKLNPILQRAREGRIASETMDENLRTHIQQKPIRNLIRRRRYGRREGVCFPSFCSVLSGSCCLQTYKRRMDTVTLNRDSDPETWSRIHKVLLELDIEGMSSDESEDEKHRP
jgi:hypothetical protein